MARQPSQLAATRPNAVLAAARRVRLGTPGVSLDLGERQGWQDEAWSYWRRVPEVKQLMLFLGNQLSKLRIFAAVVDPEDPLATPVAVSAEDSGVPPEVAATAEAELARLATHEGGISELLRRLDLNIEIPGECFLVGYGARTPGENDPRTTSTATQVLAEDLPEQWQICSVSEVGTQASGRLQVVTVRQHPGDTNGRRLDPERDTIIRIYQPDPQWSLLADSAMQGILFECQVLLALNSQVLAVANSQMHAGILTVPNEVSFGTATMVDGENPGPSEDPLDQELDAIFSEVAATPDSLMTIRPTLLRGPAQYLTPDHVHLIRMGREVDARLDEQVNVRVRRIARGLNAPVETVEGLDSTTFANATQIDRDLYDDHIEPRATMLAAGLTTGFLRPNMIDAGHADWADRIVVWFDPASILRGPDVEANAVEAHERGTISDEAYRRSRGFSETDAPDTDELLRRMALQRGITTAELTGLLLRLYADADIPEDMFLPPEEPAAVTSSAAGDLGAALLAIDVELRTRLLVAANDAVERALERAGNRLRSKVTAAQRPLLDGLTPRAFASVLGPALVADAGVSVADLTTDAFTGLEANFEQWVRQAQRDALDVVERSIGPLPDRSSLEARQDADRAAAWAWLLAALGALLAGRLFDPSPSAPAVGEHDDTLTVPPGEIRAAIARAGGLSGSVTSGTGGSEVGAVLVDGGTRAAGGIGTGELVRDQLRDMGAMVKAYRWVYGPAPRTTNFPPHLRLAGTVFVDYDDERLTNGTGWPPFGFYLPGDHRGCGCDAAPIIVPPPGLVPLV